ncbi:MAG: group I intron-associated PD-(D/E)XK endonuclease [Candidatus Sulfotelmatobacter sp.]
MRPRAKYIQHPKLRGEWAELRFMQCATECGFRVAKPWGETAPYDVATDHHGLFRRVQVKCTVYQRANSGACPERARATERVCTICSSHVIYTPAQLDFFAAYVIPTDTWYILPILATNHQPTVVLSPHLKNSKYSQYQEAWHLLTR